MSKKRFFFFNQRDFNLKTAFFFFPFFKYLHTNNEEKSKRDKDKMYTQPHRYSLDSASTNVKI